MIDVLRFFVNMFFSVFYRVEIKGIENVPKKGSALICANHVGELDMFFIGFRIKRLVRWMAKEELFRNPVLGGLIKWLGAFPVKRGKADVRAIKTAFNLLDEGHIVGIFAEGTRTRGKAGVAKVNPGAAMFAVKKQVPVIPVGVEGRYKLFSKVRVVFGEPYYIEADKNKKYMNEEFTEISRDIMKKVYGLLEGR
ncbi:1-acyl-sn-glycerol-3-phosphate acyltransferase [Anaerobacterium chartisolvens]|uniref:1-acyl-sn-glycerol-3-phosphate acyltransferase n=1 Tax=Anaerobacterium chartisolvens TaxID=1297424 RepID=A0A369BEL9_9FIRM|nr:lysophospholipid acyltransferase family protein [Anaerobacterium chartisolvens]RCX19969.1 1-acyl-sn-glycerol-3-phosphate acyltransferase [Anaerobacterium chartisolvens]